MNKVLWLRHETKPFEERTPLTAEGVKNLKNIGVKVFVESSSQRIFKDFEYQNAGAIIVPPNSWKTEAEQNDFVLGLKELENEATPIPQKHIYFSHSYKNQQGAKEILERFRSGKGEIFDLEFLTDQNNKRVAAFGHWAGFIGAVLASSIWASKKTNTSYFNNKLPLKSWNSALDLIEDNIKVLNQIKASPSALIIGANGRCGRGASKAFEELGVKTSLWGRKETQAPSKLNEIYDFDILVNCALLDKSNKPFIEFSNLKNNKRLSVVSDVSCDPTGPNNPIPIYNKPTTLINPVIDIKNSNISLTAIDHLPSLLPRESSIDFSEQLLPFLEELFTSNKLSPTWKRCRQHFINKQSEVLNQGLNI